MGFGISTALIFQSGYTMIGITSAKFAKTVLSLSICGSIQFPLYPLNSFFGESPLLGVPGLDKSCSNLRRINSWIFVVLWHFVSCVCEILPITPYCVEMRAWRYSCKSTAALHHMQWKKVSEVVHGYRLHIVNAYSLPRRQTSTRQRSFAFYGRSTEQFATSLALPLFELFQTETAKRISSNNDEHHPVSLRRFCDFGGVLRTSVKT